MSSTTRLRQTKSARAFGFKAVDGEPDGTFEAIVSVFNNVDLGGERVLPGFFAESLDRWRASGDPVPVIFSHQWDNLDAHVGAADPHDVKELLPGDPLLPPELADLGGLYVKGRLELDEDFAGRLWKRMSSRAIREFSFAYDVTKARPGTDGAKLDLVEGDLIEVGPTLKGLNPATALLDTKATGGPLEALEAADSLVAELATDAGVTGSELEATEEAGTKRLPTDSLAGSLEATIAAVAESAEIWASLEYGRDLFTVHVEATFPEESFALVTAERWEDPWGEGPLWRLDYSVDAGTVTVETATELELELSIKEKRDARSALAARSIAKAMTKSALPTAPTATLPPTSSGKAEEAPEPKAEDSTAATEKTKSTNGLSPASVRALVEAEALLETLPPKEPAR